MTSLQRDKYFSIHCKLEPTGERFPLKNIYNDMKIKDLKAYAEFATGIPVNLQRLCYLDQGDLLDTTDIRHNDIIPGATLHIKVWHTWAPLIRAAAANDLDTLFELGVTTTSDFCSPNSEFLASKNPALKKEWLADRAFVALFVASHRGHQKLCERLLATGADVNARTPYGRSPLHVAAARGHGKIVDTLLERGADIDAKDDHGETPLSISSKFGHKTCERHLFLFRWQQRSKQTLKNKITVEMFAHQYYDSTNPVWLQGQHGQVYYTQILPPGEYEGTSLNAPRRQRPVSAPDGEQWRTSPDRGASAKTAASSNSSRNQSAVPKIQEESLMRATTANPNRRRSPKKNSTSTFEDWLLRKKREEKARIEKKKAEKLKQQREEEYKEQQNDIKDKSYDNWLAEKHTTDKNPATLPPTGTNQRKPASKNLLDILNSRVDKPSSEQGAETNPRELWKHVGDDNFYTEMRAQAKQFSNMYVAQ